jgi:hypothetical protein
MRACAAARGPAGSKVPHRAKVALLQLATDKLVLHGALRSPHGNGPTVLAPSVETLSHTFHATRLGFRLGRRKQMQPMAAAQRAELTLTMPKILARRA